MTVRGLCVLSAAIAAAFGCGGNKDASGTSSAPPADPDAPAHPTLTPERLDPIVRELGPEGVVPTAIVVSFATPIVDRDEVGRVTSKSVLKLTPEVAGTLTYASASELRFT